MKEAEVDFMIITTSDGDKIQFDYNPDWSIHFIEDDRYEPYYANETRLVKFTDLFKVANDQKILLPSEKDKVINYYEGEVERLKKELHMTLKKLHEQERLVSSLKLALKELKVK